MKVTTPSDRVQLIDRGSLMHPGCCALCGSGNCDEGYVDTGIFYDYEGQVYFCWNCAMQIAAVIGCLSADETVHLQELLANAAKELAEVKEAAANDRERLNDYDNLMLRALTLSDDGPDTAAGSVVTPQQESAGAESESSDESVSESDSGESVTKEPVKSSGRRKPPRPKQRDSDSEGLIL